MKDELDGITTISQVRDIIARTNQRLETVRWMLSRWPDGSYHLRKYTQRSDKENEPYWWPERKLWEMNHSRLIKAFCKWCRANKRDTLSKAAYSHSDFTEFQESLKSKEPEQLGMFPAGG